MNLTRLILSAKSSRRREVFFLDIVDTIVSESKKTRLYVFYGLRASGAMTEALKTENGVRLTRPAASQSKTRRHTSSIREICGALGQDDAKDQ
jgi:hypothetical protein